MHPGLPSYPLRPTRMHEACGPGATAFAAIAAAQTEGPVIWIAEGWQADALNPVALAEFFDPARLLTARTANQTDTLAATEEALRDGVAPLVVAEITRPLDLREGRRLQLAAKAGGATGLCLIPEGMGSNAAETRWHAAPLFDPDPAKADSTPMRWEIIKNKEGTLGAWHVRWHGAGENTEGGARHGPRHGPRHGAPHRLSVVSAAGLGPGPAPAPR